jgi:hypothetical protein
MQEKEYLKLSQTVFSAAFNKLKALKQSSGNKASCYKYDINKDIFIALLATYL